MPPWTQLFDDPPARMDLQRQCAVVGVDHGALLANFDLVARIVAAWAACLCRLHALAVDDGSAGAGITPNPLSVEHDRWLGDCHTPASRQAANQSCMVCRGGKQGGNIRHPTPIPLALRDSLPENLGCLA